MTEQHDKIRQVNIASEMKTSFLDYAMSVIVARALPDVRDGLKPVHRRILYAMNDLGITSEQAHKKSARIAGEVIGKYHPHGEGSVYDAMVRMAQDFSYRYMLIDGHGNFGNIDGDSAAAMRYTEARMSKIAMEMVRDIKKDTIDYVDNYDGEEREPLVMPARFPNLLVNGSTGIAVGMATNIPPHNLGEVIDATIAIMDNPEITIMELLENYISGPDFPTGALILGRSGIKQAYETGRGSILVRSRVETEEMSNGKHQLIVTEIPYQVNKSELIKKIAVLATEKDIEGITDLRDESSERGGIRIVIELRKDVQSEVILNQLYRMTALQTSFGVNMLALVNNNPKQLSLKEILQHYIDHQEVVIRRRTQYDLNKARERAHILEGLRIALDNIDRIITLIRSSNNDDEAMNGLMSEFALTEIQAKAILEMRLRRLVGLERTKIEDEYQALVLAIADFLDILSNQPRLVGIIRTELTEIKDRFNDKRRSEIVEADTDIEDEDLIPREAIIMTMTVNGYIKRTPVYTYRTQNRGGKGIRGMTVNEEDVVDQFLTMSTHDQLMLFTNFGKVYRIKGYRVPSASRIAKGLPVQNLLNLDKNEKVRALVALTPEHDGKYLFFVTRKGLVKRVAAEEFDSIRQSGKIAIGLNEGDELIAVKATSGIDEIIIAGTNGKAVRFSEDDVRPMGRNAAGVKGFNADGSDVVGMATDKEGHYILSVTQNGYGKKTLLTDYRLTNRGAKGVKTINITDKNGPLVVVKAVVGDEDLLMVTDTGTIIRISLENVGVYGRDTQGVRMISVNEGSSLSMAAVIEKESIEDGE
ncbi:MAG: DNA gyrase subunit A [Erysipelotrichaceae bacterium]|nr:MAG: DNA gyrase subunit A [Erysipelotrichaceae bacterium]